MSENQHYHEKASENLSVAFFLNLIFVIIVAIGGILTNSVTILADVLHDFNDTITIALSWILEKFAGKENTETYTYGYDRLSLLGAAITSIFVISGSIIILYESFSRLFTSVTPDAQGMLIVAILGILFKGISVLKLRKGITFNEKTVLIHILSDVLRWIAVLFVSLILMFYNLPILDPLISILISLWVLINILRILFETIKVLMQRVPHGFDLDSYKKDVLAISNVESIENIHVWSLDGITDILTVKIKLGDIYRLNEIKEEIEKISKDKYSIDETTIEFVF